ncbi:putative bifunctional diguanylate cyclase/phosphodiesterase [Thalassolituus sp. LLYu03]|uniref:putative bifunctional diguanylate cyclase/phosphodiesterase n=1 Tax=Thalassolituus sp. LLYu03 TaxID=3421656 RepID=UPI003D269F09
MNGLSADQAQDHWSLVWKRLVQGDHASAVTGPSLNTSHNPSLPHMASPVTGQVPLHLESLLDFSVRCFMATSADSLQADLRQVLLQIGKRLNSPRQTLFLCPQDVEAMHVCVLAEESLGNPSQQEVEALFAERTHWCHLLEAGVQTITADGDEAGQLICRTLQAELALLVPVYTSQGPAGCLLLAVDAATRLPSDSERLLLSSVAQLCYLVADRISVLGSLRERERLLQRTEHLAGIGSWHNDLVNDRITFSRESARIFGLRADAADIHAQGFLALVHAQDRERVKQTLAQSTERAAGFDMRYRICTPSGDVRLIHGLGDVVTDAAGSVIARFGSVQDITESHDRDRRLQQAAQVFEATTEGLVIVDTQGRIEAVNPAFSCITGYRADDVIGRRLQDVGQRVSDRTLLRSVVRHCLRHGCWRGEVVNRRANGEMYPQWLSVTCLRDAQGKVSQFIALFADMSPIRRSEQQLDFLAHHDALTGLPNRSLLLSRLQSAIDSADSKRRRVAVLTIDLDHFKHINDSLGHPAGDRLLQACARRLRERLRESDTVARQGGDEFVVILENVVNREQVEQVADIILGLFQRAFDVGAGRELYIGASFGITLFPDHGRDATQLLSNADVAMYHAKRQGRNHYQFYTNDLTQAANDRLELGSQLRHALQHDDELALWFQPQVDSYTGVMVGAEALLRWEHPQEGLIMPGRFIPVAEDNGLMPELDHWVLTHACRQLAIWQSNGAEPFVLAVNITQPTFIAGGLVNRVQSLLSQYRIDPTWLELEITEGALLEPTPQVLATIDGLKALGITLAVDDFGTGYSSLAYLQRFRLDRLKIDRRFVSSVDEEEEGRVITSTIIRMARGLGLDVVAEGVETDGQLAYLRQHGCEICQGFYFSRPLPEGEFSHRLMRR